MAILDIKKTINNIYTIFEPKYFTKIKTINTYREQISLFSWDSHLVLNLSCAKLK